MNYKSVYTEDYFSGKNSFFYSLGYGRFAGRYFDRLFRALKPYVRELDKGKVLDVGCAYGFMLRRFPDRFEKFGIDISEHAIAEAKKRLPEAVFKMSSAENELPFPKNFFDVIVCNDVLEHLENPSKALEYMYAALKEGGILYINTPNLNWCRRTMFAYADKQEHHISLLPHQALFGALEKVKFQILRHWTYINFGWLGVSFRSNLGVESAFICRK